MAPKGTLQIRLAIKVQGSRSRFKLSDGKVDGLGCELSKGALARVLPRPFNLVRQRVAFRLL